MKAILFTSNMAWNNDRTDNFGNATVKEMSDLTEEEKETFYPCSLYYEVGARDDTGYETLKIENISVDGPDGSPIKVFNITTKGPDGVVRNLMHPDPVTLIQESMIGLLLATVVQMVTLLLSRLMM